jgi:hypothetical protein
MKCEIMKCEVCEVKWSVCMSVCSVSVRIWKCGWVAKWSVKLMKMY